MINLESYGIEATQDQLALLKAHLDYVIEVNKRVKLTAITDFDQAVVLHIVDSLIALDIINKAPKGPLLDMGSGGGFPGIPIAIMTNRKVVLLDSVKKKMAVLDEFIKEAVLHDSVTTSNVRAEELALEEQGKYAVITARALSSLPSLVELASPLLMPGGLLIAYKGNPSNEERRSGEKAASLVGLKTTDWQQKTIPGTDINRTVIVFEKSGKAKVKLPRRPGMAQRNPLA